MRERGNERVAKVQSSRLGAWLDHHGYSIVASLGRLLRKPWATLLTIGVMALALALPLAPTDQSNALSSPVPASNVGASEPSV